MDKVFVITVCRNAGDLLEPTMLSVLNQTYGHISYIVVDGASTDGTQEIIRKYEKHLTAWVSEPDKGIYDAMNKGLRMVKSLLKNGESVWVNFMNAGDRFSDAEVLSDLFGTSGVLHSSQSKTETMVIGGGTINEFPDGTVRVDHAESPVFLPVRLTFSHQACFVKYGDVQNINACVGEWQFNIWYKYAADYNLLYKIFKKQGKDAFIITDRLIACYRKEDSVSELHKNRTRYEYLRIQSAWTSLRWWKEVVKLCVMLVNNRLF